MPSSASEVVYRALEFYQRGGDDTLLLDPSTERLLKRTGSSLTSARSVDDQGSLLQAIAEAHWWRSRILQKSGGGGPDLVRALSLYSRLWHVNPELVGNKVRYLFEAADRIAANGWQYQDILYAITSRLRLGIPTDRTVMRAALRRLSRALREYASDTPEAAALRIDLAVLRTGHAMQTGRPEAWAAASRAHRLAVELCVPGSYAWWTSLISELEHHLARKDDLDASRTMNLRLHRVLAEISFDECGQPLLLLTVARMVKQAWAPDPSADVVGTLALKAAALLADWPGPEAVDALLECGELLKTVFDQTLEPISLDAAWACAQAAKARINTGRQLVLTHHLSARCHYARYTVAEADEHQERHLQQAMASWHEALQWSESSPVLRLDIAYEWGRHATRHLQTRESAAECYTKAVQDLLPEAVGLSLKHLSKRERLSRWPGLASEAAAAAIGINDYELALRLLERGRNLLWAQLEDSKWDLTRLHVEEPIFAAELKRLRGTVYQRPFTIDDDKNPYCPDERTDDSRAYKGLLAELRTWKGAGESLAEVTIADVRRTLVDGEVIVVINVAQHRSDAILVTASNIDHVPLPALPWSTAVDHKKELKDVIELARLSGEKPEDLRVDIECRMLTVLEQLWITVAEPVLAKLGFDAPGSALNRHVWWCPTGPMTEMPLHAAGEYTSEKRDKTVPSRVVSSYTPTLTSLHRARVQGATTDGPCPMLVVSVPHTPFRPHKPPLPDLPGAEEEARKITNQFRLTHTVLSGKKATPRQTLRHLSKNPVAHFSCHGGSTSPDDPGRLILYRGSLEIADIAALSLPKAEFAFLSSCHTAVGDQALPDESINITIAMHRAGFRSVIGTLWQVNDKFAPDMVDKIYKLASEDGWFHPEQASVALHRALSALLSSLREHPNGATSPWRLSPTLWACFVHVGR